MSRSKSPSGPAIASSAPNQAGSAADLSFVPPMKPRRKLLLVACFIFVLWVGMMIVMYFGTVYPHRHAGQSPTIEPAAATR